MPEQLLGSWTRPWMAMLSEDACGIHYRSEVHDHANYPTREAAITDQRQRLACAQRAADVRWCQMTTQILIALDAQIPDTSPPAKGDPCPC